MLSDGNNHFPHGGQPTGHHKTLFIRECSSSVVEGLTQRPRGGRFEPHQRQCIVSLSKTHKYQLTELSTGSTQEDKSPHS